MFSNLPSIEPGFTAVLWGYGQLIISQLATAVYCDPEKLIEDPRAPSTQLNDPGIGAGFTGCRSPPWPPGQKLLIYFCCESQLIKFVAVPESYETFRLTRIGHVTAALVDLFPRCGSGSALTS